MRFLSQIGGLFRDPIRLCVDPYALHLATDPWFKECNNLLVHYFEQLLSLLRNGDVEAATQMLRFLSEPNETRLGYSKTRPQGRGIGEYQADQLRQAISRSKALKSGLLSELSDCELLIPGIGPDKISDITINVLRGKLIDYTQQQCRLWGIPMMEVASGMYWDGNDNEWHNAYTELPVFEDSRLLLVPKAAVRRRIAVDHREYYSHYVLNYLQSEHLRTGGSLVRVLKNGKRKVYKKDLERHYPLNGKEFLYEFTQQHPEVLHEYKQQVKLEQIEEPTDSEIEEVQFHPQEIDIGSICRELRSIPLGANGAAKYHQLILGALTCIFIRRLRSPRKEREIHQGRKRIDVLFTNRDQEGFFWWLSAHHHLKCPYIPFECKNYSSDPSNPELDQLTGRFSDDRGNVGFLVCRTIKDKRLFTHRCRDTLHDRRGHVLALDDDDICSMLAFRCDNDLEAIDNLLDERLAELLVQ